MHFFSERYKIKSILADVFCSIKGVLINRLKVCASSGALKVRCGPIAVSACSMVLNSTPFSRALTMCDSSVTG